MAILDIIKYESNAEEFVWKHPVEDLKLGSQLIVNTSQKAFFVKGGKILDEFKSGTTSLKSGNIPLLNKLINLPFGDSSPFQAEVWYVNMISFLDNKWEHQRQFFLRIQNTRLSCQFVLLVSLVCQLKTQDYF